MESTPEIPLPDSSPPPQAGVSADWPPPATDLIDARFVLGPDAPNQERREFMHALGLSVGDKPIPDLPDGVEATVSFSLAAVRRADMHRQLDMLRTLLPSLVLEEHPLGTFDAEDADDDVDEEWDEEWDEDTMVEWGEDEHGNPLGVTE